MSPTSDVTKLGQLTRSGGSVRAGIGECDLGEDADADDDRRRTGTRVDDAPTSSRGASSSAARRRSRRGATIGSAAIAAPALAGPAAFRAPFSFDVFSFAFNLSSQGQGHVGEQPRRY